MTILISKKFPTIRLFPSVTFFENQFEAEVQVANPQGLKQN